MRYRLELAAGVVLAGVMLLAAGMVMAMVFFNVQAGAGNEHTDGVSARSPAQAEVFQAEMERERLAAEKAQLQRQREVRPHRGRPPSDRAHANERDHPRQSSPGQCRERRFRPDS